MNEPPHIAWRPEIESFLPPLHTHELRALLKEEIERHLRGLRRGTILPHKEYWDRFMVQERDESGRQVWRPRQEAEGYMQGYMSLNQIDQRLRERYGSWVPMFADMLAGLSSSHSEASTRAVIDSMIEEIEQGHRRIDRFLCDLYERFDLHDPKSVEDALLDANRFIVRGVIEEEGSDDRWFHDVGRRTSLLLESMGSRVTVEELEDITDAHFRSWIGPAPDELDAYATEVALLGVQRMFARRYGPPR